jgi:hypothetical protein
MVLACGPDGHTEIDAELANVTVSGTAVVGGNKRPFMVKLQHYPPSASESGLIVLSIDYGQEPRARSNQPSQ